MKISLNKYLTYAVGLLLAFTGIGALSALIWIFDDDSFQNIFFVAIIVVGLLVPSLYYFYLFFKLKKKSVDVILRDAVVCNWESSGRYSGRIIIKVDDKEYKTSAYFSHQECKDMVGQTVLYAIIDGVLFIDSVKEPVDEPEFYEGE